MLITGWRIEALGKCLDFVKTVLLSIGRDGPSDGRDYRLIFNPIAAE